VMCCVTRDMTRDTSVLCATCNVLPVPVVVC